MGRTTLALIVLVVAVAQLSEAKKAAHHGRSALIGKTKRITNTVNRGFFAAITMDLSRVHVPSWSNSLNTDSELQDAIEQLKYQLAKSEESSGNGYSEDDQFNRVQDALNAKMGQVKTSLLSNVEITIGHLDRRRCSTQDVTENNCNSRRPPNRGSGYSRRTLDSAETFHNVLDLLKKIKMEDKN